MAIMKHIVMALTLLLTPVIARSQVPLTDLGSASYLGLFQGGLYENGSNSMPFDHMADGLAHAARIRPLDENGNPSPRGKIVMISLGMSNTSQVFCAQQNPAPCEPWSFVGLATSHRDVNHSTLQFVNGARGGQAADTWLLPSRPNYDYLRDRDLAPAGVTEAQVQVAWVKLANPQPTISLPSPDAEAYRLLTQLGSVMRAMKVRYPNLQIVYLSSRSYGGYAVVPLNPEPYAYEYGFTVKWLIQAQIDQRRLRRIDPRVGNLDSDSAVPWITWGPYLWADGLNPRSDGLTWTRADFEGDGTHPSMLGEEKEATMILNFLEEEPTARRWFLEPSARKRSVRN
jgi:hypothetical protein